MRFLNCFEKFISLTEKKIDFFIPALEENEFEYSQRRNRLRSVSLIASMLVVFSPIAMIVDLIHKGSITAFFIVGIGNVSLGIAGLYFSKKGGLFLKYHDIFLTVGLLLPILAATFTGGVFASALYWFFALTVFTTHIGRPFHSIIVTIIAIIVLIFLLLGQTLFNYIPDFNFQTPYYMTLRVVEFLEITITLSLLSVFSQRQKERLLSEIDRQNQLFIKERERLFNNQKMQSLGEMASGIAHEINNPLMVILLKSQTAIKNIVAGDHLKQSVAVEQIQEISDLVMRISQITKGMRTFARDGSADPMEECSANKIVQDAISLCNQKFKNNNINLDFQIQNDIQVMCKPVQIIQVLINLLNNAFDALYKKENPICKIVISEKAPNLCAIRIYDSGGGVEKEIESKIFEPFFTTKPPNSGMGLGLSISHGIAIKHKGNLIYFKENNLSCFELSLPKSGSLK